jgi:hypothetical protein
MDESGGQDGGDARVGTGCGALSSSEKQIGARQVGIIDRAVGERLR